MNVTCQNWTALFGRIFISAIFLFSAFGKIMDWNGTARYMAMKEMPAVPLLLAAAIALEVGGGLATLVGFLTRPVAIAMIVYLIAASVIFHNFWAAPAAEQRNQQIHFLKNVAIMGGFCFLLAFGPGPLSLDARTHAPAARE